MVNPPRSVRPQLFKEGRRRRMMCMMLPGATSSRPLSLSHTSHLHHIFRTQSQSHAFYHRREVGVVDAPPRAAPVHAGRIPIPRRAARRLRGYDDLVEYDGGTGE